MSDKKKAKTYMSESGINPKGYRFESGIKALFDDVTSYSEWSERTRGYCILFNLGEGECVSFQQLNALSELLGTDSINLKPATEGHRYSSVTFESGTPTEIECWAIPV